MLHGILQSWGNIKRRDIINLSCGQGVVPCSRLRGAALTLKASCLKFEVEPNWLGWKVWRASTSTTSSLRSLFRLSFWPRCLGFCTLCRSHENGLWTSYIVPITVLPSSTLTEQSISEHISFNIPGRACQDVSIVLCDSTLEDSIVLQRCPSALSDFDNVVCSTDHFNAFVFGPRQTDEVKCVQRDRLCWFRGLWKA